MNGRKIRVSEDQLIEKIMEQLTDCDADEFARIAGEVLGGVCFPSETGQYEFEPNENYFDALD